MKVYGQLEKAQVEQLASDPTTPVKGQIWFNTTNNVYRFYDGTNKKAVSVEIVASDPGTPYEGQVWYNSTTKEFKYYDGTASLPLGSGGGGLDVFYKEDFRSKGAADCASGNNASFLGGGTLNGALSNDESTQIAGTRSLVYTMGASALNDYFALPVITLEKKQKANFVELNFFFEYNGADNDIEVVVYDVTNGAKLTSALDLVKAAGTSTRFSTSIYIPATCNQIRVGFQVKVGNSGKVLRVDDFELSTNPSIVYKNLVEMTDWVDNGTVTLKGETSDPTKGTMTQDSLKWRRVGDTMELMWYYHQSSTGSAGSGDYYIDLNAELGVNIDTTKLTNGMAAGTTNGDVLGSALLANNTAELTSSSFNGHVKWGGGNKIKITSSVSGTDQKYDWASDHVNVGQATVLMVAKFAVPISNWSSTSEHVITPAKSNMSDWESYTPTFTGFGTPSNVSFYWRRVGSDLILMGKFSSGNPTAVEAQISLPTGLTVLSGITKRSVGDIIKNVDNSADYHVLVTEGDSFINIGVMGGGASGLNEVTGSAQFSNGEVVSVFAIIPIEGWTSNAQFLAAIPAPLTAYVYELQPDATNGGTSSSGVNDRVLNTLDGDSSFVSLSANRFTLQAGKYKIRATAPAYAVGSHVLSVYNHTDAAYVKYGPTQYTQNSTGIDQTVAEVTCNIEITTAKQFGIRHTMQNAVGTNGLGVGNTLGIGNIFTHVEIIKVK